jgi:hypothetical protein
VGAYSNLSQEVRNKYNGYISDWLKHWESM